MSGKKPPPFLRIVETTPEQRPLEPSTFEIAEWRQSLFAQHHPNLLIFMNAEEISESDFLACLLNARPRVIVDLRRAPRFDIGNLNRRLVFTVFEQIEGRYYDLAGNLGITSERDAQLNPLLLSKKIDEIAFPRNSSKDGPILFLVGQEQAKQDYQAALAQCLEPISQHGWDVLRVPLDSTHPHRGSQRNLVFLSHATPEENDLVRWLAAHLTGLGYKVWSDVTQLIGGEEFWDDIEDAIRNHSAKVIVCLSRAAQSKKNVLDEIAIAVSTERSKGIDNLVVPIRVDDIPFTDVRANLIRKNIIDFSKGWATGLTELVRCMERDGVPRPLQDGLGAVTMWSKVTRESHWAVVPEPEPVYANWFAIERLPEHIHFLQHDRPTQNIGEVRASIPWPTISYQRLIGGFVEATELDGTYAGHPEFGARCTTSLNSFLRGNLSELPGISPKDARNYVVDLLRQGWEQYARHRGLVSHKLSSRSHAWFMPKDLIPGNAVEFIAPNGKRRKKTMVGWSDRRKVHWHFAVEALPIIQEPRRLTLRPHVIFTEDGRTPITSDARMHTLRRGFCKSWWNDRWRDLIAAYSYWLSEHQEIIEIPLSNTATFSVHSTMMELSCPASVVETDQVSSLDVQEFDWFDEELDEEELQLLGDPDDVEQGLVTELDE